MEKKTRTLSPVRQKNQAALVTRVLENLQGMSVIKSFNLTGKIVVLDSGKTSEGTHEELIKSNEKYSNFIRLRKEAAAWRLKA